MMMKRLILFIILAALSTSIDAQEIYRFKSVGSKLLIDSGYGFGDWDDEDWKYADIPITVRLDKSFETGRVIVYAKSKITLYLLYTIELDDDYDASSITWYAEDQDGSNCRFMVINRKDDTYLDELCIWYSDVMIRYAIQERDY